MANLLVGRWLPPFGDVVSPSGLLLLETVFLLSLTVESVLSVLSALRVAGRRLDRGVPFGPARVLPPVLLLLPLPAPLVRTLDRAGGLLFALPGGGVGCGGVAVDRSGLLQLGTVFLLSLTVESVLSVLSALWVAGRRLGRGVAFGPARVLPAVLLLLPLPAPLVRALGRAGGLLLALPGGRRRVTGLWGERVRLSGGRGRRSEGGTGPVGRNRLADTSLAHRGLAPLAAGAGQVTPVQCPRHPGRRKTEEQGRTDDGRRADRNRQASRTDARVRGHGDSRGTHISNSAPRLPPGHLPTPSVSPVIHSLRRPLAGAVLGNHFQRQ